MLTASIASAKASLLMSLLTYQGGPSTPPPTSTNGWGNCKWEYATPLVGTNVDSTTKEITYLSITEYSYSRTKTNYAVYNTIAVACPQPNCIPADPEKFKKSRVTEVTVTKNWTGKISGVLNWLWRFLTGTPFEATAGNTEVSKTTDTDEVDVTVSAGNKVIIFDVTRTTEIKEFKTATNPTKEETRSQNSNTTKPFWRTIGLGVNQSFDYCTGVISGDPCPKPVAVACEVETGPEPGAGWDRDERKKSRN